MFVLLASLLVAVAIARPQVQVIATNLASPRGIAHRSDGRIFVTEAGDAAVISAVSNTGSVTEIHYEHGDDDDAAFHSRTRKLVTLQSISQFGDATGGSGLAIHGDTLLILNQVSYLQPDVFAQIAPTNGNGFQTFGRLLSLDITDHDDDDDDSSSRVHGVFDVGAFSLGAQQILGKLQGDGPTLVAPGDTDPYGIYVDDHDDTIYVADAAANQLIAIKNGIARNVAFFPPTANKATNGDSVPTSVTKGPDDFLYVGTLEQGTFYSPTGGPGHSNIYRVDPRLSGQTMSAANVWLGGFSLITGITYSRHHNSFFVVEFATNPADTALHGDVARVEVKGEHFATPGRVTRLGVGQLTAPNGVAVSESGDVFVTDCSSATAVPACVGRVVKVNY